MNKINVYYVNRKTTYMTTYIYGMIEVHEINIHFEKTTIKKYPFFKIV